MGLAFSKFALFLFKNNKNKERELRVLLLGLDNSGKTTILYKLKLGKTEKTVPTVGFNVETIKYKNITMHTWDVGGQERIRALWRHYYSSTDVLIFVIDSSDSQKFGDAKKQLHKVIKDKELKGCHLILLANKQDLPNSLKPKELIDKFELKSIKEHKWCVIPTVATKGTGLTEILSWVSSHIKIYYLLNLIYPFLFLFFFFLEKKVKSPIYTYIRKGTRWIDL